MSFEKIDLSKLAQSSATRILFKRMYSVLAGDCLDVCAVPLACISEGLRGELADWRKRLLCFDPLPEWDFGSWPEIFEGVDFDPGALGADRPNLCKVGVPLLQFYGSLGAESKESRKVPLLPALSAMNDLCPGPRLLHFSLGRSAYLECTENGIHGLAAEGRVLLQSCPRPRVGPLDMFEKQPQYQDEGFDSAIFDEYKAMLRDSGVDLPSSAEEQRPFVHCELKLLPSALSKLEREPEIINLSELSPIAGRRLLFCRVFAHFMKAEPKVKITAALRQDLVGGTRCCSTTG